jgi:hypothetical protein
MIWDASNITFTLSSAHKYDQHKTFISGALVGVESHNSSIYPSIHLAQWATWWVLVHSSALLNRMTLEHSRETTIHMIQQQCSKKPKWMDGALVAAGWQNSFIHPSMCTGWCEFVGSLCSLDRMTLEQSRETSRRMTRHSYVAANQKQHMIWWHMTSREDFDENRKHAILIKISKQNTVCCIQREETGSISMYLSTYYYYYYY